MNNPKYLWELSPFYRNAYKDEVMFINGMPLSVILLRKEQNIALAKSRRKASRKNKSNRDTINDIYKSNIAYTRDLEKKFRDKNISWNKVYRAMCKGQGELNKLALANGVIL